jgi:hypothetical protein
VVLDLQPFGQFADARPNPRGQAFERQHELMLSRLQSGIAGGLLAEMQKTAYLVPQFRQRPIVQIGEMWGHAENISYQDSIRQISIVTRYCGGNEAVNTVLYGFPL